MPPASESQRRWARSQKGKKTPEGKAAKEFADADPGGKLPAKTGGKQGQQAGAAKSMMGNGSNGAKKRNWYGNKD